MNGEVFQQGRLSETAILSSLNEIGWKLDAFGCSKLLSLQSRGMSGLHLRNADAQLVAGLLWCTSPSESSSRSSSSGSSSPTFLRSPGGPFEPEPPSLEPLSVEGDELAQGRIGRLEAELWLYRLGCC